MLDTSFSLVIAVMIKIFQCLCITSVNLICPYQRVACGRINKIIACCSKALYAREIVECRVKNCKVIDRLNPVSLNIQENDFLIAFINIIRSLRKPSVTFAY